MRIAVRGYAAGQLIFQEFADISEQDPEAEKLALAHLEQMIPFPEHMIEIEFLEEPDLNQRFFRFGTDPSRMIKPRQVETP